MPTDFGEPSASQISCACRIVFTALRSSAYIGCSGSMASFTPAASAAGTAEDADAVCSSAARCWGCAARARRTTAASSIGAGRAARLRSDEGWRYVGASAYAAAAAAVERAPAEAMRRHVGMTGTSTTTELGAAAVGAGVGSGGAAAAGRCGPGRAW